MGYSLLLIAEPTRNDWEQHLREKIPEALAARGIRRDVLTIREDPTDWPPKHESAAILYLAAEPGSPPSRWHAVWDGKDFSALPRATQVLPVIQSLDHFPTVVPPEIAHFNGIEYGHAARAGSIVGGILGMLGLNERKRKVFISYRRNESSRAAEQLFETLTKRGFQVYLDIFSNEPGENFEDKLREQLADISFLILLETKGIKDSVWVNRELALAREWNLGLLVLGWPDLDFEFQTKGIHPASRHRLCRDDFRSQSGELKPASLERVGAIVEDKHLRAMALRRRKVVESLTAELRRLNLPYHWQGVDRLQITAGDPHCVVGCTARPPGVEDLFALATSDPSPTVRRYHLIHPDTLISEARRSLLDWSREYRDLTYFGESEIVAFVQSLASKSSEP